ncbi:MAG: hypothetical protein RMJ15_02090 [Nitrososphaerota archaeon]|nr:hypothetical protein [Candidatus Bathyarchaeota archaeon]MDW8022524.1 hypothetical protein [Nitrososphaerota archaeon]
MAGKTAVFKKGAVQKLLKALKKGEVNVLEPTVSYDFGVEYLKLKELGLGGDEALSVLKDLCEAGILASETLSNMATCPKCGSHKLLFQLSCPSCGSTRLSKGAIIEHLLCGYIDAEESFRRGGDIICQKCGKRLKAVGVDYRKPGILYRCLDCRNPFPTPKARYMCNNGHTFDENELALFQVKAYRLNPAGRTLLEKATLDLESILQVLVDKGWLVESPVVIRGRAGVDHEFSFAVWTSKNDWEGKPPDIVGELVFSEGEADPTVILAFWAKSYDVEAKEKIILAVPGLDEKAKTLARGYGMHVIEAENGIELQARVESMLRSMLRGVDALEGEAEAQGNSLEKPVGLNEA